ncbi:type II secretion system F family protein [Streptomyces halobius]|uniref:Type II secretion system F family protein n=1 Tax=Streptomyces halobius TaxID=2879846 RepID=A0ABY4MCF2_9ACTN|nr:type II secretion system F family protein [Streptomyces halobius]UQA94036.1 type II secretion system F family protein [Streptomyces halobius]
MTVALIWDGGAVFCAGAAGWLAGGGRDGTARRARALLAEGAGPRAGWVMTGRRLARRACRGRIGQEVWCLPVGVGVGVLGGSVVPLLASVAALFVVRRRLAARGAERERDRRTGEVIGLCAGVAGELRAGRQPAQALLAMETPGLGAAGSAVWAAARYGGDVPRALRAAARLPGSEGLTGMAACWQVAVEGGGGLAAGLERIASGLRARRDQREELRAQLAGPRATALMLALLPVCGLLMGSALGADPLRVLLHTPAGWGCLVIGGLLEWGGVAWTARIIADAMPAVGRDPDARRKASAAVRGGGECGESRC